MARSDPSVLDTPTVFDLLESDEHDNVPRSDSEEVGGETLVEGHGSFVLKDLADHDDRIRGLSGYLVHQTGLEDIDGGSDDDGVETSSESAKGVESESLTHS